MARKTSVKVVLNRQCLDAIREGEVEGFEKLGQSILDDGRSRVPDAPPYGKGLVETGAYGVWADGKKVAGTATKPRTAVVKSGVTVAVGYRFPARFLALGTIHIAPHPEFFVSPMNAHISDAPSYLRPSIRKRLAGVR